MSVFYLHEMSFYSTKMWCSLGCPKMHQNASRLPLSCRWLPLYLRSHQQKFHEFWGIFEERPLFSAYTKEILKNTKENMPSDHFRSHFWQEGLINIIPSPDCCICLAVSGDTHIDAIRRHMSIWPYGHMVKIWPYGHIAIWLYGIKGGQYGCFWKQQ